MVSEAFERVRSRPSKATMLVAVWEEDNKDENSRRNFRRLLVCTLTLWLAAHYDIIGSHVGCTTNYRG
jgi:hypothetical protein